MVITRDDPAVIDKIFVVHHLSFSARGFRSVAPATWNSLVSKGVFIATQLNSTQLTQLNSVQPSQSCFCL